MYLIYLLHITSCLIYFGWWYQKNKEEAIYRLVTVFFIPVFGFLYLAILDIWIKQTPPFKDNTYTLHELEKDVVGTGFMKVDFEREVNVAPMEDALFLNNSTERRKLIIHALREDVDRYLDFLNKALDNDDPETTHYAASGIMEKKRRLSNSLQELAVKFEADRKDKQITIPYADVLKNYLNSGLMDDKSYIKYKYIYANVLQNLLEVHTSEEQYFIDIINSELELGNFEKALEYCDKFMEHHPKSENTYLQKIKVYFYAKDNKKLQSVLLRFKQSDIKFSNDALNTVRYWSEVTQ